MSQSEQEPGSRDKTVKSPRQRSEANPEKILDSAMELMAEHGYAGTSLSMICKRSGYPVTSIYWHFGSKEQLLLAALERSALQAIDAGLDRLSNQAHEGEPIENMVRFDSEFLQRPPPFWRLTFLIGLERSASNPEAMSVIARIRKHVRVVFTEQILQIVRPKGQKLPRDIAEELAHYWLVSGDGLFVAYQLEPGQVDQAKRLRQHMFALEALAQKLLDDRAEQSR